ncbi:hypothetical protein [Methylorubrum extorquens]|uniref:hypothetical protein n=1 Tax=Methylorubrum extorquens TaxID=408 RepID=UPI0005AB1A41|nr:hypothetical protein [Methylorubrum extorquens]KQP95548.1 hypothetical protein ASF55_00020 [Methylobacterium sp. Leaf119]WIU39350.1 hypothetical protein KQ926_22695 [Methylorubrum extorquens]
MRKPLTVAETQALRPVAEGATRIRDLRLERVGRVAIERLTEAGLIDTSRFLGAVYAMAEGHRIAALAPNSTEGRSDRA